MHSKKQSKRQLADDEDNGNETEFKIENHTRVQAVNNSIDLPKNAGMSEQAETKTNTIFERRSRNEEEMKNEILSAFTIKNTAGTKSDGGNPKPRNLSNVPPLVQRLNLMDKTISKYSSG